ncbi:MAG TPA: hypothetical protein VGC32_11925 [Solirubrobacterales bacterium]
MGALGALAILITLIAGCGGSGSSEDPIRERVEGAAAKTAAAPTLESTAQFAIEAGNGPEPTGCGMAKIDRAATPKVDLRSYHAVCGHRPPGRETIAIGKRAWVSTHGHWVAFGIRDGLTAELLDETSKFHRLFGAASSFREGPGGDEFDAPFSAVGAGPLTESGELHFDAVIDQAGYLTALNISGVEEGATLTVEDSYEGFGAPVRIAPPPPAKVTGPKVAINGEPELRELFETLAQVFV